MRTIGPDEQGSSGAKSARRFAVVSGNPLDSVTLLARATSPYCATVLAGELPNTITAPSSGWERL